MSQPSTARVEAVRRATKRWERDLVDASGRSPLRRYRDLKTGTLDLTPGRAYDLNKRALDRLLAGKPVNLRNLFPAAPDNSDDFAAFDHARAVDQFLADKPVSLGKLFPDGPDDSNDLAAFDEARRRFAAIHKTSLTNLEEKGIETLFVAIGLATWKVGSGNPPNAPVVLLPLDAEATGAAARDFRIQIVGDALLNPVLAHILRTEHDMEADDYDADLSEDPPTNLNSFRVLLNRLRESWNALPGLAIEPRVVAATFRYSTMPLVADLEQNGELFAASDIVAAIAGDKEARAALASRICDPAPYQPDTDPPANEFLVLDADSSQHVAINRVLGGESLVIQGPPGTGKSQTIANLVTTLIARGKRVLFVAEKRAAIEAVTKRLNQVGLSDLVMDMHGGVTSRRDFARKLNDSLERVATIPALDYSALHGLLRDRRDSLIANDAALHQPRAPWKLCVFDMQERLLAIPEGARTQLRLSTKAARGLDSEGFERLARDIDEWIGLGGHALTENHPEWSRSTITNKDGALEAFDLVSHLTHESLPAARDALFTALDETPFPRPATVAEWSRTAHFLVVANGSRWARLKAQIFSKEYRSAKQAMGAPTALSLTPEKVSGSEERVRALFERLAALVKVAGIDDLDEMSHSDLSVVLERMASNRNAVARLPRIRELEGKFREAGIWGVIERVGKDIPPEHAACGVEHAWLRRVLDDLEFDNLRIAAFDSGAHSRRRDEFAEADREHRDSTPQRVRRLAAEATNATMSSHPEETTLVRREAAKKRRHLSIRRFLARAPHVLSTLRPCWTMSPILAAEMIPADLQLFDVVIFDEASQIPPAEGIGCLARAPQAVIAGDSHQLPPTSFFGHGPGEDSDDDDDSSMTEGMESLLDAAGALLRDKMLEWHYRSRDERLIAFSNNHIYGGSLTAFPGAIVRTPITHCLIPFRPITSIRGTRSNPDEVAKVVEIVLEHARKTPHETLGVIAFGQHHAYNIDNALNRRLGDISDHSLDEFFSEKQEERFFVKNIERVQGDERAAIILSVGYHKDVNGNLPYRFGPILHEGGERRLNVAVTRARSRLTLVSSFSHRDMDPGRSAAKGVYLLRQYLEYAASGGENLGSDLVDVPLNPFELSIKDGLDRRGIPVTPQYGVSGYRIDFACAHPREPGRMVLAIEADGASYHSAHTTRDRDRLRQQVLESKGWRFHRIWSTAWFRDREAELDKAEEAWKRAVEASDDKEDEPPQTPGASRNIPQSKSSPQRGPRPNVPCKGKVGYDNITDYSHSQLVDLARWIESDTLLRTDDDLIREMMNELGFKRSGKLITDALRMAIRDAR